MTAPKDERSFATLEGGALFITLGAAVAVCALVSVVVFSSASESTSVVIVRTVAPAAARDAGPDAR